MTAPCGFRQCLTCVVVFACVFGFCFVGCSQQSQQRSQKVTARKTERAAQGRVSKQKASPNSKHQRARKKHSKATQPCTPLPPKELSAEQISAGWIQLFDGVSLFGWRQVGEPKWNVENGTLCCKKSNAAGQGNSLIVTTSPFGELELHGEVYLEPGAQAAVWLYTPEASEKKTEAGSCCRWTFVATSLDNQKPQTTETAQQQPQKQPMLVQLRPGTWHNIQLKVSGKTVSCRIDGQPLDKTGFSFRPDRLLVGPVGLAAVRGTVRFRHIHLRPLNLRPLFNGRDLSGWRVVPGSKSRFVVKDQAIHVENGPGFLETEGQWADFVLQFTARTNGKELNSGVFFRAMKGTEKAPSNGYEVQIHNGFKDGKRCRPSNAGTGAIFRRTTARWIVADDNQWFTVTLIASGAHFAVWVNGLQVTDWTDTRAKNENPRRGLRLKAGHISLQGHDPTTNLDFKDIRLVPLPSKNKI